MVLPLNYATGAAPPRPHYPQNTVHSTWLVR